jgi:hypothetical protein
MVRLPQSTLNGVLNERVPLERRLAEVVNLAFDALDRDKDVFDIVLYPQRLLIRHTGLASAITLLRNFIDKSAGVFTSTFVWVRRPMSAAIAAMSKSVMPSAASINRSRSLTSVSS